VHLLTVHALTHAGRRMLAAHASSGRLIAAMRGYMRRVYCRMMSVHASEFCNVLCFFLFLIELSRAAAGAADVECCLHAS
jgi:hypothetical protein